MFRENLAGEGFDFAEGDGFECARPLKAETESTDAAEEIKQTIFHSITRTRTRGRGE